jgi:hypothetical protein
MRDEQLFTVSTATLREYDYDSQAVNFQVSLALRSKVGNVCNSPNPL